MPEEGIIVAPWLVLEAFKLLWGWRVEVEAKEEERLCPVRG